MQQLIATMCAQEYHPIEDKVTFTIDEGIHNLFKRLSGPVLEGIISLKPDVDIDLFSTTVTAYARWMSHVVTTNTVRSKNWKEKLRWIRNRGPHPTSWAIAAAELISALRFILGYDKEYTDYSAQFLVDFVDIKKGKRECSKTNGKHHCFNYSISKALEFVAQVGTPEAKDWVYVGCRGPNGPPNYNPKIPRVYIKSVTEISSVHEALPYLEFHPIGASLAFFEPDFYVIEDGVYRGPMYLESVYKGFHAVNIYAITEENGETIALVKSSHGERWGDGGYYFKVSCDVLMIEVPKEGEEAHKHYRQPMRLLSRFSFPTFA